MGLIGIILMLMAGVGFLTFGFTISVCKKPANSFHGGAIGDQFIGKGSVVIHGLDYNFTNFRHPSAGSTFNGSTIPLYTGGWNLAGNDASFLFQNTNKNCYGYITKAASSSITGNGSNLNWYFPCNIYSQYGNQAANLTGYETSANCHLSSRSRQLLSSVQVLGQVYYTWDDVKNPARNLAVFET
jgi:chitin synthase